MDDIEFIVGNKEILNNIHKVMAWRPFDERIISFCGKLSDELNSDSRSRLYPDVVALSFWLREKNIVRLSKQYNDLNYHLGKGLVFHIAPGNVALSFAYSLITGLLAGNTNIIRMSSREFEQADLFCNVLLNILKEDNEITQRICLIKYPHKKSITDELSSKCHMRIIWGGDQTINTIRQSWIPPRTTEITYADRFSICLINADKYLVDYSPKKVARDFYNDTFLTDQNACSSPRIICWMGENIKKAKKIFWDALYNEIEDYIFYPVVTVDKILRYCKYAANNKSKLIVHNDYRIVRVEVDTLNDDVISNIGNSGFFYEYNIHEIQDILPICTWKLQTLSYLGLDNSSIREFVLSYSTDGIDKILPVGKTMDFSLVSDGFDIIREMTRNCHIV